MELMQLRPNSTKDCSDALISSNFRDTESLRFQYSFIQIVTEDQWRKLKDDKHLEALVGGYYASMDWNRFESERRAMRSLFSGLYESNDYRQTVASYLSRESVDAYKSCIRASESAITLWVENEDKDVLEVHGKLNVSLD